MQGHNPKSGFTLVELLVVIAIIVILASILFPVFGRAREKARTAACSNNLKQIMVAFKAYMSDYDNMTPGGAECFWQPTYPRSVFGARALGPYLRNEQILICPSSVPYPEGALYDVYGLRLQPAGGYAYTYLMGWFTPNVVNLPSGGTPPSTWSIIPRKDSQIRNDANLIVMVDYRRGPWLQDVTYLYERLWWNRYEVAVHNEGINCAYYDGHVKWQRLENLRYGDFLFDLQVADTRFTRPISQPIR